MSNTHSLWPPPPWKSAVRHHGCKKLPYPLPRIQSWQRFLLERLKVVRNLEQVVVVLYASCASRTKKISCHLLRIQSWQRFLLKRLKVIRNLEQVLGWVFCMPHVLPGLHNFLLTGSFDFIFLLHTSSNIKWHVPLSVNWTFTCNLMNFISSCIIFTAGWVLNDKWLTLLREAMSPFLITEAARMPHLFSILFILQPLSDGVQSHMGSRHHRVTCTNNTLPFTYSKQHLSLPPPPSLMH